MNRKLTKYTAALGLSFLIFSGVQLEANASNFKDVPISNPNYEAIEYVKSEGIMKGNSNGEFMPEKFITRKQMAIVLGNSLNIEKKPSQSLFSDVKKTDEANPYITELTKRGIFQKANTFNPNGKLTEAQLVKIIVEGYQLESKREVQLMKLYPEHWAYQYYQVLVETGVMTQGEVDQRKMNKPVKRELVAKYIYLAQKEQVKHEYYSGIFNKELMQPTSIDYFIKKSSIEEGKVEGVKVTSKEELKQKLVTILNSLPEKVYVSGLELAEVEEVLSDIESTVHPKESLNIATLANYSVIESNGKVVLSDTSHNLFTSRSIELGLKEFSKNIAKEVSDLEEHDKINVLYNYIFDNFNPASSEGQTGATLNPQITSAEYARLFYELAIASDIEAEVIRGENHYWNRVILSSGEVLNVDISTDSTLNKIYYTLGDSTEVHQEKTTETGLYSTLFSEDVYDKIKPLSSKTEHLLDLYFY